ncbi:MAG TPA: tetratricopeptide repeat protein [Phaeodactylibacter sp.]|nr:tetratricopeptide repeat protein [Phaeodactylibacter sp.]
MKHYPFRPNARLKALVGKFERMRQKKTPFALKKSEILLLVDYYDSEKIPDKAIEVIDYGIAQFHESAELQVRKTRLFIYNHHHQYAKKLLNRQQFLSLNISQVRLLRLELLISEGKIEKALSNIAALKEEYASSKKILSEIFYLEALAYEKSNRFTESFDALCEVLWIAPEHQDALGKVWMTTEISRKSKDSIVLNSYLLQKEHYSALTWFNLGHAYYSEAEYKKSMEALEFCIIINEDFKAAYFDVVEVCTLLGLHQKATQYLKEAIERFEIDEIVPFMQYGEALIKCGDFRMARKTLKDAQLIDPSDPDLLFLIGETHRLEKNWKAAIPYYELILEEEDYRDDVFHILGGVFFLNAEYDKAEQHFERAIELDDNCATYRSTLASFYLSIGDKKSAEEVLSEAVTDLENVTLEYHYAAILLILGKNKKGMDVLNNALQKDFESYESLYEFAPTLVYNQRVQTIINYYQGE